MEEALSHVSVSKNSSCGDKNRIAVWQQYFQWDSSTLVGWRLGRWKQATRIGAVTASKSNPGSATIAVMALGRAWLLHLHHSCSHSFLKSQ